MADAGYGDGDGEIGTQALETEDVRKQAVQGGAAHQDAPVAGFEGLRQREPDCSRIPMADSG